jgi:hypothetical protein
VSIRQVPAATARSGTQRARQTSSSRSQLVSGRACLVAWPRCGSLSGVVRLCPPVLPLIVTQLVTRALCHYAFDSFDSGTICNVKSKRPWWKVTTSLRLALILGGGYLILGLGELAGWLVGGKTWLAVGWGIYFLCGTPWYITTVVLLKQRHSAASNQH